MNLRISIDVALAKAEKSQIWLAEQIGVEPQSIYNMRGRNSCSQKSLEAMAQALGMSVSEFVNLGEG